MLSGVGAGLAAAGGLGSEHTRVFMRGGGALAGAQARCFGIFVGRAGWLWACCALASLRSCTPGDLSFGLCEESW